MSLDDSGDDLFITQSSFRKESLEINTQDANSAADFLLDVSFSTENLQGNSPVKSVPSCDTPADIEKDKCGFDSTPFIPLLPDFFQEGDADKVSIVMFLSTFQCFSFLACHVLLCLFF